MTDEYTPTTEQVKRIYVRTARQAFIASTGEHEAEFTRWLAGIQRAAWDEGFAAADISRPTSRKGHWEDGARKGIRTWIPDPLPTNPYIEDSK